MKRYFFNILSSVYFKHFPIRIYGAMSDSTIVDKLCSSLPVSLYIVFENLKLFHATTTSMRFAAVQ